MEGIKIAGYNSRRILKAACKVAATLFSGLTILLSFVTWEDLNIQGFFGKSIVFLCIMLFSVSAALLWICVLKKEFTVYEKGINKISICYGDIMRLGFPKKNSKKRTVVIPVNTCFDTIVDENIAENKKLLVSPEAIHGQWLLKFCEERMDRIELDRKISEYLESKIPKEILPREKKERGNLNNYEIGTIVPVAGSNKVTFLLVALSEFDENNNAKSSKDKVIQCAESILDFQRKKGQGYDLYLPLMGTGLSGADLSPKDSVRILKSFFQLHANEIRGTVNIVIYSEQKSQVSIYD